MFNKSFFKFFFGFLSIVAISFVLIIIANYWDENGGQINPEVQIAN